MSSTGAEEADARAIRANKLQLVEKLADDLAHEIKNPLHSMVINLEVLRRKIARLPEELQVDLLRYAGVLDGELDRVTRRIDLLFRLVRPERGREMTTFPQAVQELLDLLELERERHKLTIDFSPAPQPLRGHLPREIARQIALNLLFEALNATHPGGTLTIHTELADGRSILHVRASPVDGTNGEAHPADLGRLTVARSLVRELNGALSVAAERPEDGAGETLHLTVSIPTVAG
jgi:signal transduction histidine kinase